MSDAYFGAGGEGLTLDEVESHLEGDVAAKAKADYDEFDGLLQRVDPGAGYTPGSGFGKATGPVSVEMDSTDAAELFMHQYLMATEGGHATDFWVELHFQSRWMLTQWLRTLPEPED